MARKGQRSFVQVSKSTSLYQYTINDSRYNWIENVVNASIGVDMSQNEGIDCLQNRLHVLRQKLSQDSKVSCNTPREPDELPEATIDDEMISDVDDPMVEPTVTFESSSDSALDVTSDESEVSSDSEGSVDVPKIADETEAEVLSVEPPTETMAKRVSNNLVAPVVKKRKRQHTRTVVAKLLAPRFKQGDVLEWSDNGGKK